MVYYLLIVDLIKIYVHTTLIKIENFFTKSIIIWRIFVPADMLRVYIT